MGNFASKHVTVVDEWGHLPKSEAVMFDLNSQTFALFYLGTPTIR